MNGTTQGWPFWANVRLVPLIVLVAMSVFWRGISLETLIYVAIIIAFWAAARTIEAKAPPADQAKCWMALVSAALFLVLVIGVATWHGQVIMGALTWLFMTIAGFWLLAFYERT